MPNSTKMENVFANRLGAARKMAGLSLQQLADRLGKSGVSKQALSKYEKGVMKPGSQVLLALSKALEVKIDYFFKKPELELKMEGVEYRKFISKLSKTEQYSIEAKAKEKFEKYFELENLLGIEEVPAYFKYESIVKSTTDAENAAKKLRKNWDLGYDAIPDVVEMLEDKGYKVIELKTSDSFDGLKAMINQQPVIALKECEEEEDVVRKRFTALHELAHHSLNFSKDLTEKEQEKLCHAFASAVLYPEEMARKELHKERFHFYQQELVLLKERWGISISAIFSRALQLGLISDYVYKKFNIGFKKRGYHIVGQEPGRFRSKEKPSRMERLIYIGLAKEIISINEAAYFADVDSWELRKRMDKLV